jgi:anion-transporting  ArsA/GET3 family ATPase
MTRLWEGRKVVVAVGTGGVGKTTASASLAIAAATQGLRTLVMTIDPARRLAHALGVADGGNVEREIQRERLQALGVTLTAPLWVMVPDVKRTFDEIVGRSSLDAERQQQIFSNRIYQHFSSALSGSHEYAAIEKLYEVYQSGRYDLIVLDTPPSQQAVDFLDAPNRILDFLENETLQWLLKPYSLSGALSLKVLDVGSAFFWRTLGGMAGGDTLRELAEFILSFRSMYEGFRQRSRRVRELLASEELAFALVTTTAPAQQHAMLRFRNELMMQNLTVRALIVNRVRPLPTWEATGDALIDRAERLLAPIDIEVAARLGQAAHEELVLARADLRALRELRLKMEGTPVIELPERPSDVHDLAGLSALYGAFL